jgi:hypothetical protein
VNDKGPPPFTPVSQVPTTPSNQLLKPPTAQPFQPAPKTGIEAVPKLEVKIPAQVKPGEMLRAPGLAVQTPLVAGTAGLVPLPDLPKMQSVTPPSKSPTIFLFYDYKLFLNAYLYDLFCTFHLNMIVTSHSFAMVVGCH